MQLSLLARVKEPSEAMRSTSQRGAYPTFKSDYTPNGTFNNCYVSAGEQIIFVRGARVNRRNLSDEYLDDHIVRYDWNLKEWRELGHVRGRL